PNRIFVGLYPGFASIYYKNGKWKDEARIEAIKDRIYRIEMDEDGTYWLGNDDPPNGTANLTMNRYRSQLASIQIASYDTSNGLPKQFVYPVKGVQGIIFTTSEGLCSFDKTSNTFAPYLNFGAQFADGSLNTHRLEVDKTGNVWMCTLNEWEEVDVGYAWPDQQGQYHWENKPFRGITEGVIMDFLHEANGITWLGGTHGLFRYDAFVKANYDKDFSALIRQVIVGREVVIHGGSYLDKFGTIVYTQPDNMKPELKYAQNSISFQFAAYSYEGTSVNTFSYRLDGFENEWSPFKPEATAKFTNLHEGSYSFRVRGQNLYGHESKEAVYEFTILPPWYRTMWAYIGYILLFIGLIYMIVRVSIYRLNAAKVHLEKVVAERTAEVVKQKEEIAQKNKDITASIRYAERIQSSLLPSGEELSILPDGFVLFQPKDIVSGDFYWMQHHNDRIYLAACDCTGHGVPGAFMSMIGSSFLDEAVIEKGITQPNEIFFEVRKGFIKALKQTGEKGQQKDGMDATLIAWDKKTALQVASAFNPVLIIRKGEIEELKPDRQPVGFHTGAQKPFTHHEHKLEKGDTVYIFSDGYPDQFGGKKDKKFMMKNFKKLLLSIQDKAMNEQKTILEETMAEWRGDTEQVDDILVMGVRF
ncbi:MAG TPA: hypothetical protein EYM84_09445, partial [Flavobacteriales bacterium]|nr:hypothetical protein [Flavobacteriales bacterium]